MTDEEIQRVVVDIIGKRARADAAGLTPDTNLGDLRIESLAIVEILFEIEEAFDIYIPQEVVELRTATLRSVCDNVKALVAARHELS